ncbi:MAG: HNH endonuclease, partial [Sphingobacteriales bacterium]
MKSDAWQRKRYIVLKRDKWRCVYCNGPVTQVHHKKYAKYNIGREPIEWLVSVCKSCHDRL